MGCQSVVSAFGGTRREAGQHRQRRPTRDLGGAGAARCGSGGRRRGLAAGGFGKSAGALRVHGGRAGRNAVELLPLVRDQVPDVVVVDIRMPPTHTTEVSNAARIIRQELPDIGIMVLSAHVDVEVRDGALAGGRGVGYLLKSRVTDVGDFIDSLRRIAKGGSVVDPALVQELVSGCTRRRPAGGALPALSRCWR